jgi:hypothetical protein
MTPSVRSMSEKLFMASRNDTHVHGMHPCWTIPDNMIDGNGIPILPQVETPFYKLGGPGKKVFRSVRVTYDVRSTGGSAPTLAVDFCTTPTGAYTYAGSFPATTDESRGKMDIRKRATGIGLRLRQAIGQSGHTTLSEIELDQNVLEPMR